MNVEIVATVEGADPVTMAVNLSDVEAGGTGEALPTAATACESLDGATFAIRDNIANCAIAGASSISFEECGGYVTLTADLAE